MKYDLKAWTGRLVLTWKTVVVVVQPDVSDVSDVSDAREVREVRGARESCYCK